MKVTHVATVRPAKVSVNHGWDKSITLKVEDLDGSTVEACLTLDQVQSLLKQSRNALIDAKVLRGKKQY